MKTSRTFLRECSVVSPLVLLLFGGTLQIQYAEGFTLVDGWLRVRTAPQTAVLVKQVQLLSAECIHALKWYNWKDSCILIARMSAQQCICLLSDQSQEASCSESARACQ